MRKKDRGIRSWFGMARKSFETKRSPQKKELNKAQLTKGNINKRV